MAEMERLEPHLSFKQIATLVGASPDWVKHAWKRGDFGTAYLDISKSCSGQEPRIPESAVRAFLARRSFKLPIIEAQPAIKAVG